MGVASVAMGAEGMSPCLVEVIVADGINPDGFGADGITPGARNVEEIRVGGGCDGIMLVGRSSDGIRSARSSWGTGGAEGMMFMLDPVQVSRCWPCSKVINLLGAEGIIPKPPDGRVDET